MSSVFAQQPGLTIAHLAQAWGKELAADPDDAGRFATSLSHILRQDIANGRLDNTGPYRDGQSSGLRFITPDRRAGYIESRQIGLAFLESEWAAHYLLVTREAALDVSRRHRLRAPSWWQEHADFSTAPTVASELGRGAVPPVSAPAIRSKAGGRRPKKLEQVKHAMRREIQSGSLLLQDLRNMLEKTLAARYGVSRDTTRKARDVILSEMSESQSSTPKGK